MHDANPLDLVTSLRETLNAYLPTTLPISRRYPELSNEFRTLLRKRQMVKGPYVEALPDFEKGATLRSLLASNNGFLTDDFVGLPDNWLDRQLHLHQQEALEKACRDNENLVVATGTGSGKTECFLFPLVQMLANTDRSEPGVRCLLVYPMNALANGGQIPSNWLLTREEMLATPPDILITNYAMLEHLLLLPRNAPLFAQNKLHTVVLDEIHTYSGAQATEVAFLLRKLKNRLGINRNLQVYGTSASLAPG